MKVLTILLLTGCGAFAANWQPSTSLSASNEAVRLLQQIATGSAKERRDAILGFDAWSKGGPHSQAAVEQFWDAAGNLQWTPEGARLLLDVIPKLIEELKGKFKFKAFSLLISIQGRCPHPEYDVWRQWWDEEGKAKFEKRAAKK